MLNSQPIRPVPMTAMKMADGAAYAARFTSSLQEMRKTMREMFLNAVRTKYEQSHRSPIKSRVITL
jgi:hypothetical protein